MAGLPPDRISRFLTYLLRHRPKEYPLVFDKRGFVDWRDLVELMEERFYDVTDSQKQRFELQENKVRATYGHSFPLDLGAETMEPPDKLYCGTARDLAASMLRDGLKPRDRQYVHLSVSAEEAESVARRHDPAPGIIIVDAQSAHGEGIRFFQSGPLFLVENVPAKFLSLK